MRFTPWHTQTFTHTTDGYCNLDTESAERANSLKIGLDIRPDFLVLENKIARQRCKRYDSATNDSINFWVYSKQDLKLFYFFENNFVTILHFFLGQLFERKFVKQFCLFLGNL